RLVQHGLTVTILERGGFLLQEPENWDVNAVFFDQKYVPEETWLDKEGTPFRPGTYYYVGGSSKLYGGAMLRLRERDFENLEHAETDAEVAAIKPALATGRLTLKTNSKATRLILTTDGRRVNAVEYECNGGIERITAPVIVLSASAVNSAVLLLRSACDKARHGIANSSGVVGRNYMAHNNTALMSIGWKINDTNFQKTIC